MTPIADQNEIAVLRVLDEVVRHPSAQAIIEPIASRVEAQLNSDPTPMLAWEPISLDTYSDKLPNFIRSSWIFVLRANSASGAERHPNSYQRVMSYRGGGDLQIRVDNEWRSHLLRSHPHASLESRWASIPPNTWHQGVVLGYHWVVVSFHTVSDRELIEERLDPTDPNRTCQRRYLH